MEIMCECQCKNINALLVSFDFYKAFNSVEWDAIYVALEKFGFGKKYIEMVKIIYTDPLICASNNGYLSQFVEPTRATRQGCCFLPGIFNLIVELLGLGIRQNINIHGIEINKQQLKSGQYGDDLWTALIASQENLNEVLQELEMFSHFSGLVINPEKTVVLKLGPFRDTDAKFYTLKKLFWSPAKPIKILGIQIYPDWNVMHYKNYTKTLEKVKDILNSWKNRSLTIIGKITVINTLISTLYIHKFLALPSPSSEFFCEFKRIINEYLWKGKCRIAYNRLIQDYDNLGL